MKYLFFFASVLGILPAAVALLCERSWIRWAVLGLFLPLIVFNSTAINFFSHELYRGTSRGMEISIIYIAAVIILAVLLILGVVKRIFPDAGSRLYLIYFLFSLPSLYHADQLIYSFFELWKMVMIYLVFLAVYYYLEYSKGDFDIFLYGIAIVVFYNFLQIILQHFRGIYQVRGTFPHQNSLAMYMLLAGLIFFSRYFNLSEGWKSRIFFLVFGMASVTLFRTYSRGAIACYPLGALVSLLCSIRFKLSSRKCYIIVFLLLIGIIGLAVFLPKVVERFQKAPESSGQTRKNFAVAAVNMMKDVPLTGVGINNWGIKINPPYNYSRHREAMRYKEDYKDGIVETVYLLVGAECGIPCLLVFLLWIAYYWISTFRLLRVLRNTPYFYLPAGILGGLTGILMQSCLEWVLKQQINFMFLITVFAFISYLNKHGHELSSGMIGKSCQVKENTI